MISRERTVEFETGEDTSIAMVTHAVNGELLYSFCSDELGDLYNSRDSLPVFTAFSRVVAYVNVINNGPEYTTDSTNVGEWVFLNYGKIG